MMLISYHQSVPRTTLTLEDDVAARIDECVRNTGSSLKDTVNELIRLGLLHKQRAEGSKPFRVHPVRLGLPEFDSVEELLDRLDGEDRKW